MNIIRKLASKIANTATAIAVQTAVSNSEARLRVVIAEVRRLEAANQTLAAKLSDRAQQLFEARSAADVLRKERTAAVDRVNAGDALIARIMHLVTGEGCAHYEPEYVVSQVDGMQADARACQALRRSHEETCRQIREALDPAGDYAGVSIIGMAKSVAARLEDETSITVSEPT